MSARFFGLPTFFLKNDRNLRKMRVKKLEIFMKKYCFCPVLPTFVHFLPSFILKVGNSKPLGRKGLRVLCPDVHFFFNLIVK